MPNLTDPIQSLQKLQKPQIAALKKLGLVTLQDLLLHFPYRYLDFSKVSTIADLHPGENVSLKVTVKNVSSRFSFRSRLSLAEAVVSDSTGSLKVVWFNQPYLAKTIAPGDIIYLAGSPEYYKNGLQLTNPLYEKDSDFPIHTARLVPVYHLTANLYPKTLRSLVSKALPMKEELLEVLPSQILTTQGLPSISKTVELSHFPASLADAELANKRLAFEEIFINQLAVQKTKLELLSKQAYAIAFEEKLIKSFVASLPFQLTSWQKKATWDILQDMEKPTPTNRLVEGDVGSGKTLVALIAALEAAFAGYQVALLAPTEILARQHFETTIKFLKIKNSHEALYDKLKIYLLTNNYSKFGNTELPKKDTQAFIQQGTAGIYIGTHALLADKVKFSKLALVIIDEQHRFGVEQRRTLIRDSIRVPHLISLSATPIPRSLQLAIYGDLDVSQIKSKPQGRKSIITNLIDTQRRGEAYSFIQKQIQQGRQAFVITPLVEESDKLGVKAATSEVENLKKIFPGLNIGLMHGRLKGTEKEKVMADFLANKYEILVSTSVVEVGVDVPNASVMLIEDAERFGLAQLHQFRGRVGRSEHQSYCFLFSSNENPESQKRLQGFTKTQDGFELAELDLKQRGFGQLYGTTQSGVDFRYFSPAFTSLIEPARQEAKKLLQEDQNLINYPYLQEKISEKVVHFE